MSAPRLEVNVPELDINSDPIRRGEIRQAIKQLKNSKAPGCDDIPAELRKADLETTSEVLFVLFSHIWQEEQIPDDWHRGLIVKIPKKGDTTVVTECTNLWRAFPVNIQTTFIYNTSITFL